jgi:hypothetical protein
LSQAACRPPGEIAAVYGLSPMAKEFAVIHLSPLRRQVRTPPVSVAETSWVPSSLNASDMTRPWSPASSPDFWPVTAS